MSASLVSSTDMAAVEAMDKVGPPCHASGMERVVFHLEPGLRRSAEAGQHNFIGRIAGVLNRAGIEVGYADASGLERALTLGQPGRAMFHMAEPLRAGDLTFRRVYHYPFWQIERTGVRWDWEVARASYDGVPDEAEARRFYGYWQTRLFGEAARKARSGNSLYVPLQGLIREHRSFQSCAPVEMVEEVLGRADGRRVIVGLHPNERYADADLRALEGLCRGRAEIRTGGMIDALKDCACVITQNSSAAFNGYFFGKPAILFGRIDFHHIAANVLAHGVDGAFEAAATMEPDYAGYIWWFWQKMAINAGRPEADQTIAERLRALGWPV